jgi:hypothetical protein
MKFVNLRGTAYVNGQLRHPHEGTLHLVNDEADRLIKNELADDVTDDFPDADNSEAPAEHLSAAEPEAPSKGKAKA